MVETLKGVAHLRLSFDSALLHLIGSWEYIFKQSRRKYICTHLRLELGDRMSI
jgi:hypothetical protein